MLPFLVEVEDRPDRQRNPPGDPVQLFGQLLDISLDRSSQGAEGSLDFLTVNQPARRRARSGTAPVAVRPAILHGYPREEPCPGPGGCRSKPREVSRHDERNDQPAHPAIQVRRDNLASIQQEEQGLLESGLPQGLPESLNQDAIRFDGRRVLVPSRLVTSLERDPGNGRH